VEDQARFDGLAVEPGKGDVESAPRPADFVVVDDLLYMVDDDVYLAAQLDEVARRMAGQHPKNN
jgi:hypothetical protein